MGRSLSRDGTDRLDSYTLGANLDTAYFEPVLVFSGTVGYVHDNPAITLVSFANVVDDDNSGFNQGRLQVHIGPGSDASNRLAIGGSFTVDANNNVLQGATIIGKRWSNGFGTNDLAIQSTSMPLRSCSNCPSDHIQDRRRVRRSAGCDLQRFR